MDGEMYPERRVAMHLARRSEVRGRCLGANWGSALRRPVMSMCTWVLEIDVAEAPERSLMKKLIPLRYA